MPKSDEYSVSRQEIARLAVAAWRLGVRIQGEVDDTQRLLAAHERLMSALGDIDVQLDDPIGVRFIDGMTLEVIDAPAGASHAELFVAEVLRPTVRVGSSIVLNAQVVLSARTSEGGLDQ